MKTSSHNVSALNVARGSAFLSRPDWRLRRPDASIVGDLRIRGSAYA
jgi:hypothetical protein